MTFTQTEQSDRIAKLMNGQDSIEFFNRLMAGKVKPQEVSFSLAELAEILTRLNQENHFSPYPFQTLPPNEDLIISSQTVFNHLKAFGLKRKKLQRYEQADLWVLVHWYQLGRGVKTKTQFMQDEGVMILNHVRTNPKDSYEAFYQKFGFYPGTSTVVAS